MTYITFDIFKKMCRYGKIEDGYEYNELYRRKIVPTNLIPINPAKYYKKTNAKPNAMYTQMFEKKHGRKCNWRDKDDVIEYHGIRYSVLGSTPEYKARVKKYRSTPKYKAKQKAYEQSPKTIARRKAYSSRSEVKARRKALRSTPEFKAKQKALRSTPEYIAYQKTYRQRPDAVSYTHLTLPTNREV